MAEEKEKNSTHSLSHEIGLGVTVVRALLLVVMGLSLLFVPDKTYKTMFNMMGLFWLTTGIVLARREAHTKGSRLLLVVAILGVVTGVLVITRDLTRQWLAEVWVRDLLGVVILLTGVLHATVYVRKGRQALSTRPIINIVLGVAEIFLGVLLILSTPGESQNLYFVAIVWSLLVGGLLLVSTVLQWLRERRQEKVGQTEGHPGQQADQTEEQPGEPSNGPQRSDNP